MMSIRNNRKAIMFSLISVLFAVLFVTIFSRNFDTMYEDRMPGSNIRIKVIDVYTRNFDAYISSSVKVATYRTLDAITVYRRNNSKFFSGFDEFNETFYNCITCGYVDCTPAGMIPSNDCKIGQYTLKSRLDTITNLSMEQMNIKTEYVINSITISQNHPFEVEISVDISYNVSDGSGEDNYARWEKHEVLTQGVRITGLLDPTGYINDSGNAYKRTIIEYTGLCAFDDRCWNYNTTSQFYNEYSFRSYSNGTSFLQRYWNDNTPSDCCGLETILHPSDLSPRNMNNSHIDHYYWNGTYTCSNGQRILVTTFGPDSVYLDERTNARYGLTNNSLQYCIP